jgi:spermidine synthase
MRQQSPHQPAPRLLGIISALFFVSGFPALICQLTWQRALFRIFGVNIESVTVIVAAFMLGLGIGSLAGGFISKRRDLPLLLLLAIIETLTGIFGYLSLEIFAKAGDIVLGWPLAATAVAMLSLVLIPTLLMGATLPLLVGYFVRRTGNVGNSLGSLYFINTLGAGLACFLAAFALFPFMGMQGSIYVAVALNAIVAAGALVVHIVTSNDNKQAPKKAQRRSSKPALGFALMLGIAFVGGFLSLSYELFFFRALSFASGSLAIVFALTLGIFLIGIAAGALKAGSFCRTASAEAITRYAVRNALWAGISGILFLPLLGQTALPGALSSLAIIPVFLVAYFWSTLLPCLAQLGIRSDDKAGMQTAWLYLANIFGSTTGTILTGFVFMNYLGLVGLGAALAASGALFAVAMGSMLPTTRRFKRAAILGGLALFVFAAFVLPAISADFFDNIHAKKGAPPVTNVVENRSGIITVDANGTVYGNGMYDGKFNTDLFHHDTNGIVRPYALSLFHPKPHDVMMIGLSSGSWAQVIANNPDVESLTIVEINPGYLKLIAERPEVASVLANPKVSVIVDDGRRWLNLAKKKKFDVIVLNMTWHFRANATNLLSAEFLELVKKHLKPGGIFFYNTTGSLRVQRTACLAFSHGALFINHMAVSMKPIDWNFWRWRKTLKAYQIDDEPIIDTSVPKDRKAFDALFAEVRLDNRKVIVPCKEILAKTSALPPVTDDNMGDEWHL